MLKASKMRATDNFIKNAANPQLSTWKLINSKRGVKSTNKSNITSNGFNIFLLT